MCPNSENNWCKYQLDKINGTQKYKYTIIIQLTYFMSFKPIFQDLSKEELLSKCLHSQTQNTNEALNAIIWTWCPKNIFVGRRTLEMLRYFNFEASFKLRWCLAQDLFGSQIPVTTGGFEMHISWIQSSYLWPYGLTYGLMA